MRRKISVPCGTLLLLLNAIASGAELRVGAAAVNLPADDSMVIAGGIGPRYVQGQEGQLRAVAVVLELAGRDKVALVACDVLFTPQALVEPALAQIKKQTGIPPDHVLVNATHTHHAPATSSIHGYPADAKFCAALTRGIAEAVRRANGQLQPATAFFRMGQETTVGQNSRLLMRDGRIYWIGPREEAVRTTGPFDPALPVFSFRGSDGKLISVFFGHSTHTIGTEGGDVRSPSFYGLAAQELEAEQGGVFGFLEGASGSTHALGTRPQTRKERIKRAVNKTLTESAPHKIDRLAAARRPFEFTVRTFDEAREDEKVRSYTQKYAPGIAEKTVNIFRQMRRKLKAEQGQTRRSTIQAIAIGDVAIVGLPGEYFTSLGLEIKRRSPFARTVIAELAGDWIGYLPDREGHRLGGYQTWMGEHSYAEPGTGERMADEVVELLEELKPRADD